MSQYKKDSNINYIFRSGIFWCWRDSLFTWRFKMCGVSMMIIAGWCECCIAQPAPGWSAVRETVLAACAAISPTSLWSPHQLCALLLCTPTKICCGGKGKKLGHCKWNLTGNCIHKSPQTHDTDLLSTIISG